VKYCLDTNIFIEAHRRYYAFDIAPPFWNALADWGAQRVICATKAVYEDLANNNDELSGWVKAEVPLHQSVVSDRPLQK